MSSDNRQGERDRVQANKSLPSTALSLSKKISCILSLSLSLSLSLTTLPEKERKPKDEKTAFPAVDFANAYTRSLSHPPIHPNYVRLNNKVNQTTAQQSNKCNRRKKTIVSTSLSPSLPNSRENNESRKASVSSISIQTCILNQPQLKLMTRSAPHSSTAFSART